MRNVGLTRLIAAGVLAAIPVLAGCSAKPEKPVPPLGIVVKCHASPSNNTVYVNIVNTDGTAQLTKATITVNGQVKATINLVGPAEKGIIGKGQIEGPTPPPPYRGSPKNGHYYWQ